ncbi:hypothetical protein H072_4416 [Dactylellina haptotyla CBS 200.50]|uniref:Uncharacterized protein n=1 Tax=Dactylellina haptotyla (strain CBS 200.50) TaxID=1284197 RepID=S8AFM6_DACHA|nr:hypothetical protein H072_4416 [Dactylellina haptotyla CBS 200.50]
MSLVISPGGFCNPWMMIRGHYCLPTGQALSWPSRASARYIKPSRSHLLLASGTQLQPVEPRPPKRVRTNLNVRQPLSPIRSLQEGDLRSLSDEFQNRLDHLSAQPLVANIKASNGEYGGVSHSAIYVDINVDQTRSSLPLWHDRCISLEVIEDFECPPPPLPVSPLQKPDDLMGNISPTVEDMVLDPLGDIEMSTKEETIENGRIAVDATGQAADTTSYPLVRYLEDGEVSTPSPKPSITRPDIIRSTAPIDIKKELQRFESDISHALEGMKLAADDGVESHLQGLEARFSLDDSKGLAGNETDPDDIFTLDGDEAVVFGPRDISSELETWISESSLIVGRSLKPLAGSVVGSTSFPEEQVHIVPHGRKRKASTCQ